MGIHRLGWFFNSFFSVTMPFAATGWHREMESTPPPMALEAPSTRTCRRRHKKKMTIARLNWGLLNITHRVGGRSHRLQAGRAEPVDGGAGSRHRAARPERRVSRHVPSCRPFWQTAANEHIFDLGRGNACTGDGVLNRVARQSSSMGVVEFPTETFGEAGACSRHNHGRAARDKRHCCRGTIRVRQKDQIQRKVHTCIQDTRCGT